MKIIIFLIILLIQFNAYALDSIKIQDVQKHWAIATYSDNNDEALKIFLEYEDILANVKDIDLIIWRGIIKSSHAKFTNPIKSLALVKSAKKDFELAISIDQDALNGSALTSLGALYLMVPSWPIGFGDDDKAKNLLLESIKIDPKGIDVNYFYGLYLYEQNNFKESLKYLNIALKANPRKGRPIADLGRKKEINQMIKKCNNQINLNKKKIR